MASLFKSFFRGGEIEKLPEELRKLLEQAKRDRKALRELVKRLETSSRNLKEDAKPLDEARAAIQQVSEQVDDVRSRAETFSELAAQVDALKRRADGMTETVDEASAAAEGASQHVKEITSRVDGLSGFVDEVTAARKQLADAPLDETQTAIQNLTAQLEEIQSRVDGPSGVASRVVALEQRASGLAGTVEQAAMTVDSASKEVNDLNQRVEGLSGLVADVTSASKEMAAVVAPSGVVAKIRESVGQLRAQMQVAEGRGQSIREMLLKVDVVEDRTKEATVLQLDLAKSIEAVSRTAGKLQGEMVKLKGPVEAVGAAKKAIRELTGPEGSVVALRAELGQLEDRLTTTVSRARTLSELEGRIGTLEQQTDLLSDQGGKITSSLEAAANRVGELDEKVSSLREGLDAVATAKQEVAELAGPGGTVANLREQAGELREQFGEYRRETAKVREDQSGLRRAQDDATSRYEDLRARTEKLNESVEEADKRIATVEGTMRDLSKADELAARTERHLNALRVLADHVMQKTVALERQREVVDRTETQARNVASLQIELQAKLKDAREQVKEVKKVHGSIDTLRAVNKEVAASTAAVRVEQSRVQNENEALRTMLGGLHEEMRQSAERFELENSGLEAISRRILDLRGGLTDFEHRFETLDGSIPRINDAADRADALSGRLTTIASQVTQLSEHVEQVEGMRGGIERAEASAAEIANRLQRLEALQEETKEAVRDLTSLRRSREEVRDALEHVRSARAELERLQAGQTETNAWLATVQDSVREVRAKVSTLDELAAAVDYMRRNADRVVASANNLEARGESMEAMDLRITELIRLGTQLDERTRNLFGNLEDADHRFQTVVERAGEADEVRRVITTVAGEVRQAERRITHVSETVDVVAGRAEAIEGLSKRMDRILEDIDLREQALVAATESLDRVATLRREAAEVVEALENQVRTFTADLRAAEAQAPKVMEHAERLEARVGSLRFVDKRLTQFEEKLARLDSVEQELGRSLESLTQRQETIDVIRDDLKELFETANNTLESVRATSAARDEVRETHENLEVLRVKSEEMTRVLGGIDKRQRQIEEAEERLTKADALLMDIRGGLEILQGQKAVVDHVIETTGKLTYETKEAEGLIATLRQEREMTQRIHDAIEGLRGGEGSAKAS